MFFDDDESDDSESTISEGRKGTHHRKRKTPSNTTDDKDTVSYPRKQLVHSNAQTVAKARPNKAAKGPRSAFKKAPDAPKRFKSAYIFFSTEKHKEIRAKLNECGVAEKTGNISRLVSAAWKELSSEERAKWETMARNDRSRYDVEKTLFKGSWHVPKGRQPKDSRAPKRPMSAFLAFANSRRGQVKQSMPGASNGDVSRALASMWKGAPDHIRRQYIDDEREKRSRYNAAIADWRKQEEQLKLEERRQREELALRLAGPGDSAVPMHDTIATQDGGTGRSIGAHGLNSEETASADKNNTREEGNDHHFLTSTPVPFMSSMIHPNCLDAFGRNILQPFEADNTLALPLQGCNFNLYDENTASAAAGGNEQRTFSLPDYGANSFLPHIGNYGALSSGQNTLSAYSHPFHENGELPSLYSSPSLGLHSRHPNIFPPYVTEPFASRHTLSNSLSDELARLSNFFSQIQAPSTDSFSLPYASGSPNIGDFASMASEYLLNESQDTSTTTSPSQLCPGMKDLNSRGWTHQG